MADASDVASRKVKQLILLVDKMEQAQVALDAKLKASIHNYEGFGLE